MDGGKHGRLWATGADTLPLSGISRRRRENCFDADGGCSSVMKPSAAKHFGAPNGLGSTYLRLTEANHHDGNKKG